MGQARVTAKFQGEEKSLELVVVRGSPPSLLGREWIKSLSRLRTWFESAPINRVDIDKSTITALCKEFGELFEPVLGKIRKYQAHIYVKPDAQFRFFRPRAVAFAMREKIEADLDRLLKLGVIEPVQTARVRCNARGSCSEDERSD